MYGIDVVAFASKISNCLCKAQSLSSEAGINESAEDTKGLYSGISIGTQTMP